MKNKKNSIPEIKTDFFKRVRMQWRENCDVVSLQKKIIDCLPCGVNHIKLFKRLNNIGRNVLCAHNPSHALEFILDMLRAPRDVEGCFVEAGCFKGGSTAKFSIIAKMLQKKLIVFDSFEGLPNNNEGHETSLQGHSIKGWFEGGAFACSLDEARKNIFTYGEIDVCRFVPGWFENSLPSLKDPVLAAFIDVDLADSTKTCLEYIYPKLVNGGVICSQDGDFPLVIDVFKDLTFWRNEVGVEPPICEGLGKKITRFIKRQKNENDF